MIRTLLEEQEAIEDKIEAVILDWLYEHPAGADYCDLARHCEQHVGFVVYGVMTLLSRLCKTGEIVRVWRPIYDWPGHYRHYKLGASKWLTMTRSKQ